MQQTQLTKSIPHSLRANILCRKIPTKILFHYMNEFVMNKRKQQQLDECNSEADGKKTKKV